MILIMACIFSQFFKTWTFEEKEARQWMAKYEKKQSLLGYRLIASGLRKEKLGLLLYLDWQCDTPAGSREEAMLQFKQMVMEMKESLGHDRFEVSIGWASALSESKDFTKRELIQLRFVSGMVETIEQTLFAPGEKEIHLSKELF